MISLEFLFNIRRFYMIKNDNFIVKTKVRKGIEIRYNDKNYSFHAISSNFISYYNLFH